MASARAGRRSPSPLAALLLALAALLVLASFGASFVAAPAATRLQARGIALHAEATAAGGAPSPSPSVALVKVTEENKVTTASVLGGLAGLLVGGVWVGAGLFAASAYLSKKEDDDISKALKGVASGGLEVLNFGAYLNDKYTVTDRLGSAVSDALDSASQGSSTDSPGAYLASAVDAVKSADREVDFKGTLGTLAASATDLAFQAVEKAVDLNAQYKITDQVKEKIDEAISGAQAASTTKTS